MCNRPIVRFLPRKDIRQPAILKVCLPKRAMAKWFSATFIAMRLRSWPGVRTSLRRAPCGLQPTCPVKKGKKRPDTPFTVCLPNLVARRKLSEVFAIALWKGKPVSEHLWRRAVYEKTRQETKKNNESKQRAWRK
jgi:hypothetical protein